MNFYISLQFPNSLKDMLVKTRESILSVVNNSLLWVLTKHMKKYLFSYKNFLKWLLYYNIIVIIELKIQNF